MATVRRPRWRFNGTIAMVLWFAAVVCGASQFPESIPGGAASIAGRVTDYHSQRGLESVLVTLTSANWTQALTTLTDSDGRYVFEGIAPDEYGVTASHRDYATAVYQSSTIGRSDVRLVRVASGQPTLGIDFSLLKGASISGRITNHTGEAIKGANVTASRIGTDGMFVRVATGAHAHQ